MWNVGWGLPHRASPCTLHPFSMLNCSTCILVTPFSHPTPTVNRDQREKECRPSPFPLPTANRVGALPAHPPLPATSSILIILTNVPRHVRSNRAGVLRQIEKQVGNARFLLFAPSIIHERRQRPRHTHDLGDEVIMEPAGHTLDPAPQLCE